MSTVFTASNGVTVVSEWVAERATAYLTVAGFQISLMSDEVVALKEFFARETAA